MWGGGPGPASPELNLVDTVDGLPAPDDLRWDGDDAPSCVAISPEYRNGVAQLFGGRAGELGLAHAFGDRARAHESSAAPSRPLVASPA